MTLTDLSDAWNVLRNAALGRGTKPIASPALADKIGNAYERWRKWLETASPVQDIVPSATAWSWLQEYRALVAEAMAEGIKVDALPGQPLEAVASFASTTITTVAIAVAAIGLPVVALMLFAKRKR